MTVSTRRSPVSADHQRNSVPAASADGGWFVSSPDGSSAIRIVPGLRIGETDIGVIALNDPMAGRQLIRFDVTAADGTWLELMSADHKMVTRDGASIRRERVSPGLLVVLPSNRLVISPGIAGCEPNGSSVEVMAAAVPAPAEPIRTSKRRPRPAATRRLRLLIVVAVMLSAAAALVRYPGLQKAASTGYAMTEDVVRTFMAESLRGWTPTPVEAPASASSPARRSQEPSASDPPVADVTDAVEPTGHPVVVWALDPVDPAGALEVLAAPDDAQAPGVPEASAVSSVPVPQTAEAEAPDRRLARARRLLSDGFIVSPPRRNAVAVLGSLLTDQPANAAGLALLGECADLLVAQAVDAKQRGEDFEARNTLEEVLSFSPGHQRALRLQRRWIPASP